MYLIPKLVGSQRWVSFGPRDRLIRFFCNPDRVKSFEFEVDFFGFLYKGNLNSYIDWSVYFYGAYEREYLLLMQKLLIGHREAVFIDIGANVGVHSLYLSRFCQQVHSFEPNSIVRSRLQEKVATNNVKNIAIHGVGVGMENEVLPFFAPKGGNQGTGSFISDYSDNNETVGTPLELVQGDEYLNHLKCRNIDLIKIDVEGFEKNVLLGIRKTLEKFRPIVCMEYSESTKESFKDLTEFLSVFPNDYKVYRPTISYPYLGHFGFPVAAMEEFDFDKSGGDLIVAPSSWTATDKKLKN